MKKQSSSSYHIYEYVIPLEDWEVAPERRDHPRMASMAYYPHSNRIYVRWIDQLSNPIRHLPKGMGGSDSDTHWGLSELHSETTFYVRDIPVDRLPTPYTYVTVSLRYSRAGGPTKDDPLGQEPAYDVIRIKRIVYGDCPIGCLCNNN